MIETSISTSKYGDSKVSMYIQMEKTFLIFFLVSDAAAFWGKTVTVKKVQNCKHQTAHLVKKHTSKIALAFTINKKPWHFSNKNNQSFLQELIRNLGCFMISNKTSVLSF